MFARLKKFLTSPAEEARLLTYAKIGGATFGLAAIASSEHVASLHEPITWSVAFGVIVAGGTAVVDLVKPLLVAAFTKDVVKGA